jgi:peptidoglycan/xylan/chitin deacetylase (PgdA/CDA1 family)
LDRTRKLIFDATGRETFVFRTPGSTDNYLRSRFQVPRGYQLVLWDVHSLDQEGHTAAEIVERVLSSVKDGDVILMHNGLSTTREALKTIIPALQARGFQFVTVSEILESRARRPMYAERPVSLRGEIWTK